MPRPSRRYEDLAPARRRRHEAALLARSVIVGVLLFVAYYLLPLNKPEAYGLLLLVGGLILIAVVVAHYRSRSVVTRLAGAKCSASQWWLTYGSR